MNRHAVQAALALDAAWVAALRSGSVALLELAVWGDVTSTRLGAVARLRKRALDLADKLRAVTADRGWIPRPREQLKNALASALAARDALNAVGHSVREIDGGRDLAVLKQQLDKLASELDRLDELGSRWATLLDTLNRDRSEAGD